MPQSTRTFRVFVSSTFNDLKAERNALQERVFPRLRELAAHHGCRFQAVDLRWGVSDEASLDQQAINICLGEIARCQQTTSRPNFIVLLGDRYGWCPPPSQIPEDEFEQIRGVVTSRADSALLAEWYFRDENAVPPEWCLRPRQKGSEYEKYDNWQPVEARLHAILAKAIGKLHFAPEQRLPYIASATEQEIAAGALRVKEAPEHVLCFFRNIDGLPQEFQAREFLSRVEERLKQEYPEGLSQSCKKLVQPILEMAPNSSAKDFADRIKQALKQASRGASEEGVLNFIKQVLVDCTAKDFLNLVEEEWTIDEDALEKQNDLKERLRGYHIFPYQVRWTGDGISTDHIDQLCEDVYNSLSHIIEQEIGHPHQIVPPEEVVIHIQPDERLDAEGLAHHQFAEERLRFFVGRTEMLAKIADYLKEDKRRSLAIVGAGGTGKSALMARAIQQTQESLPKAEIVYRFIGVTPGSSEGRSLLESLCHEISRRYGVEEEDIPTDYRDLVPELRNRMQLASANRPLILFLDSLDQFSASQGARSLIWLPDELPEHVWMIASTREEDTLKALHAKQVREERLGRLSRKEGEDLLSQWLVSVHRTLQEPQRKEVLDKFIQSEGNPLYLKLAFEEARLWTSGSGQPAEQLEPGIRGIIEKNMINRLRKAANHGEMLVSRALGYLAASRYGLAEDELLDLLSRDVEVYEWFFKTSYHMPADLLGWAIQYRKDPTLKAKQDGKSSVNEEKAAVAWFKQIRNQSEQLAEFLTKVLPKADGPRLPVVLWSRLSFDLAPYLSERMVDGSPLLNFYHRELGEVASAVFLDDDNDKPYHERLAEYFRFKADPQGDGSWTGNNPHGLSELPYHLIKAENFEQVDQTLTDISFLDAKNSMFGPQKLISDFELAAAYGWTNTELDQYSNFLRKNSQKLDLYRELFFTLIQFEGFPAAQAFANDLVSRGRWLKPWLRLTPCWIPPQPENTTGTQINILTHWDFERTALACVAEGSLLVFFIKELGSLGMVDLKNSRALLGEVWIRKERPLALCSSHDARFVVAAFEDGTADVLEVEFDRTGEFQKRKFIGSVPYYVPKFEKPVMEVVGHDLWLQAEDGSILCDNLASPVKLPRPKLFEDTIPELSGFVSLGDCRFLTFRKGKDTELVLWNADQSTHRRSEKGTDVVSICPCGPSQVAVAFKNRTIGVFDTSAGIEQIAYLDVEELPRAMVRGESDLLWATYRGSLYTWNFHSATEATEIEKPGNRVSYEAPFNLVKTSDHAFALITRSSAITFNLNERGTPYGNIRAIFSATEGAYCAIEETADTAWFIDSASKSRLRVVEQPGEDYLYAMNDLGQLLGTNMDTGRGFVVSRDRRSVLPISSIPLSISSICGHSQGGFWLADTFGNIFHLRSDRAIQAVQQIDLNDIRGCAVYSARDLLIWRCACMHQTSYGNEFVQAIIFFQVDPRNPSRLIETGRRFFSADDGNFQTLAYDPAQQLLWMIWQASSRHVKHNLFIKKGSIRAFIDKKEVEEEIQGIDLGFEVGISALLLNAKCQAAYCLTNHGSLVRLDIHSLQHQAVLSASEPITAIAPAGGPKDSLLCVFRNSKVYSCEFIGGAP